MKQWIIDDISSQFKGGKCLYYFSDGKNRRFALLEIVLSNSSIRYAIHQVSTEYHNSVHGYAIFACDDLAGGMSKILGIQAECKINESKKNEYYRNKKLPRSQDRGRAR